MVISKKIKGFRMKSRSFFPSESHVEKPQTFDVPKQFFWKIFHNTPVGKHWSTSILPCKLSVDMFLNKSVLLAIITSVPGRMELIPASTGTKL